MSARAVSLVSSVRRWLLAYPYTTAGVVALILVSVPFVQRDDSEWEYVYVNAAQHLRDGTDIYQPEIANSYPPFATLIALPFTYLSPIGQRWLWLLINLGCFVFMLRAAWRLAGGERLQGPAGAPLREHAAALLGLFCGLFYLQNCFAHHQSDLLLGAFLFGGCLALNRERSFVAASCFGLAAAVKCTPLLWAPYLVWRRRLPAAVWLLAVALGVNLLPDLVHASPSGRLWLTEYVHRYLQPLGSADHYVGTWASALVYNQSLAGAGQRWFVTTLESAPDDFVVVPRIDALTPQALRLLVLSTEAIFVLLTLAVCRRPFQRVPLNTQRPTLEYSVVFLLMLLLSPMSSKAHFGVLLLPGFCLARAALSRKQFWLLPLLFAAVAIAVASNKGPFGERLYTLTLWLGCVTWETLLLLAGCLTLLALPDRPATSTVSGIASTQPLSKAA